MSSQFWCSFFFLSQISVLLSSKMNYVTKCFALHLNFGRFYCFFFFFSLSSLIPALFETLFRLFWLVFHFLVWNFSLLSHSLVVICSFHQFRTSCDVKWVHRNKNWPAFCSFVPCDNDDDYGKTLWNVLVWSLAFFLLSFILLCIYIYFITVCMRECACRKTAFLFHPHQNCKGNCMRPTDDDKRTKKLN